MKQSHNEAIFRLTAIVFWLGLWQIGANIANRSLLIPIPTVWSTALALLRCVIAASFWLTVGASLLRILLGFLFAFLLGTVLAFGTVHSKFLRALFSPILAIIQATPVASVTLLLFLWIGREKIPSVISFFAVLPIVWATMDTGIQSLDSQLREMGTVFGMSRMDILRKITFPQLRSFFSASTGTGLGFAWKSGVAAEIICRTQNSLGNLLWESKTGIDYDEAFAITIVVIALSVLLQKFAQKLLRKEAKNALS